MPTIIDTFRSSRRAQLALAVGLLTAVALAWFASQRWATSEVIRRVTAAGAQVARADVSVSVRGSAVLRNVTWSAGPASATIESVEVDVALSSLLSTPRVERIAVAGVKVVRRVDRATPSADASPTDAPASAVERLLERLGGTPPEVVLERVDVSAALDSTRTIKLVIDHGLGRVDGQQWRLTAPARLEVTGIERIKLPPDATVMATMNLVGDTWSLEAAGLRFTERAQLAGPDELAISIGAVAVTGNGAAQLSDIVATVDSPFLVGPVKFASVEAGPLRAIAARDLAKIEFIRVSGADVTLQPPKDVGGGNVKVPSNWNDRLATLLGRAFAGADEALAVAQNLGATKLTVTDSTVKVPRIDSTFAVREGSLHNGAEGPVGRVAFGWTRGDSALGGLELAYAPSRKRLDVVTTDLKLAAVNALVPLKLGGTVNAKVAVTQATDEAGTPSYPVEGRAELKDLRFEKPVLAVKPIEAPSVDIDFAVNYAPRTLRPGGGSRTDGVFTTSKATFRVGKAQFDVRPEVLGLQALPDALPERVSVEIDVEATPVQDLFDAVPSAILGELKGAEFSGTLALHGRVDVPLQAPERMKWELEPELADFRIVSLPNEVDVRRLMTSASFTLQDEKLGHKRTVFLSAPRAPNNPLGSDASSNWTSGGDDGCGSYVYVPLDQISPHLASGVFSTEDRGFLWHDGFNVHALRESLAANLEEGRIVRGGSTITMQLIKNLFLDRSKTISRKLREVFLVWLTETVVDVPKPRLLEVYFNVIEYGPRILGIWHAATYFFGKHPRDLTVGEVAWFITTLTGPKIYHHQFLKGQISEAVWGRMRARIRMLYHNDYITELDLVEATARPPTFRPASSRCAPYTGGPPAPNPDAEVLATELLRLRRGGMSREEVTKRLDDIVWRIRVLAAPHPPRSLVDWGALPLARDKYSWWSKR